MSDLSPKDRALLDCARDDWGPSEAETQAVRRAIDDRVAASGGRTPPDDDLAGAPGPTASVGRTPRAPWLVGGGVVLVGLCVAALAFVGGAGRGTVQPVVHAPPAESATAPTSPTAAPRVPEIPTVALDSLPDSVPLPAAKAPPRAAVSAANETQSVGASSSAPADTLAEELALLHAAQKARRDGQPDAALAALATHSKRFPTGVLREERMTLEVLSLCDRGSVDQARSAMRELARLAPGSSHLQRLSTSCAAP